MTTIINQAWTGFVTKFYSFINKLAGIKTGDRIFRESVNMAIGYKEGRENITKFMGAEIRNKF